MLKNIKKKAGKILLIVPLLTVSVLAFTTFYTEKAAADVGEVPTHGYTITSGTKTNEISMEYEKVTFDITERLAPEHYTDEKVTFADVTAYFEFKNLTTENIEKDLIFPIPSSSLYQGKPDQSSKFKVLVNGQEINYKLNEIDYKMAGVNPPEYNDKLVSLLFSANFQKKEVTEIQVEYEQRLVNLPKSEYVELAYIMETGSHWAGKIKKGEIVIEFEKDVTKALFREINDEFKVDGTRLTWEFTEFEPLNDSDNVRVIFSPKQLRVWNKSAEKLEDIEVNNFENRLSLAEANLIPQKYLQNEDEYYLYWMNIEGAPAYLLDKRNPAELDWYEAPGMVVKLDGEAPAINYEFEGTYEVDSLKIFPGIKVSFPKENSNNEYEHRYDLLNQAKKVKLTFDNGKEKIVEFSENPSEYQTISLEGVESSEVQVKIIETYTNANETDSYLGIGRLGFVLGEKIEENGTESEEDEVINGQEEIAAEDVPIVQPLDINLKEFVSRFILVIGGCGFVLLVTLVGGTVILIKSAKKAKNKKKENG